MVYCSTHTNAESTERVRVCVKKSAAFFPFYPLFFTPNPLKKNREQNATEERNDDDDDNNNNNNNNTDDDDDAKSDVWHELRANESIIVIVSSTFFTTGGKVDLVKVVKIIVQEFPSRKQREGV